jgi:UDP-N-acetylmuramoyl-tripeptide--D-alanyl-D-alanine ligase
VLGALLRVSVQRRVIYGTSADASYRILERKLETPHASRLVVKSPRGPLELVTPLVGASGALATVAAMSVVDALGEREFGPGEIEAALRSSAERTAGRMRPRELTSGLWLIDDSYNANPASCRSSIATAHEIADLLGRRLVVVLGEMRELGAASVAEHRALGEVAADVGDLIVAVGGDARHLAEAAADRGADAMFMADARDAADVLVARVLPTDVVLVKGSRGVRTEHVVEALAQEHDAPLPVDPSQSGHGCPAGGAQ